MVTEITRHATVHLNAAETIERDEQIVVEEPLEICVGDSAAVVMRTPGDDFDLAAGFAFTEGLVTAADQIGRIRYGDPAEFNRVELRPAPGKPFPDIIIERTTVASSACGLCGKKSVDDVFANARQLGHVATRIEFEDLLALPGRLREHQRVFDLTGGLHAAGIFSPTGELDLVREDVGRHNAVDKVVGHLVRRGAVPANAVVLCVSGRAGFEIVQKAAVAGIPIVVAVSAPSSLAVELADRCHITLAAFVRDSSCNIYTHPARVEQ